MGLKLEKEWVNCLELHDEIFPFLPPEEAGCSLKSMVWRALYSLSLPTWRRRSKRKKHGYYYHLGGVSSLAPWTWAWEEIPFDSSERKERFLSSLLELTCLTRLLFTLGRHAGKGMAVPCWGEFERNFQTSTRFPRHTYNGLPFSLLNGTAQRYARDYGGHSDIVPICQTSPTYTLLPKIKRRRIRFKLPIDRSVGELTDNKNSHPFSLPQIYISHGDESSEGETSPPLILKL